MVDDPEALVSAGRRGLGRLRRTRVQVSVVRRDRLGKRDPASDGHKGLEPQPMRPPDLEIVEHMGP